MKTNTLKICILAAVYALGGCATTTQTARPKSKQMQSVAPPRHPKPGTVQVLKTHEVSAQATVGNPTETNR